MRELTIKKGQIIQRQGELNSKFYHVKSGLLRSYAIDKNDKESIFMFASEGWVIADTNSPKELVILFIDALQDSIVLELPKDIRS